MMKITDLNKNNIKDIEYNNVGFSVCKIIASQIIENFVNVDATNGIVDYNESEIDLIIAHIYLRMATDLFDEVEIGDENVNDILIQSGYHRYFINSSDEADFVHNYVWDSIKRLERINSIETLGKVALLNTGEKLNQVLNAILNKVNEFNSIEAIDTVANSINKLTRSLNKKDIDKLRSVFMGGKNEVN